MPAKIREELTEKRQAQIIKYVEGMKRDGRIGRGWGKMRMCDIARRFGLSHTMIKRIVDGNVGKLQPPKMVKWKCPYCKKILTIKKSDAMTRKNCLSAECIKKHIVKVKR